MAYNVRLFNNALIEKYSIIWLEHISKNMNKSFFDNYYMYLK